MKCIALVTRFSQKNLTWFFPEEKPSFFPQQVLKSFLETQLHDEITCFFNELQSTEEVNYPLIDKYFVHVQKLNETDGYAVICDIELSPKQRQYLSISLLSKKIPPRDIVNNLEYYTQDFKTHAINADLTEVLDITKKNLEKALKRGEKLDDLVEKTELLERNTTQFKRKVDEKTSSCWPSSCTIS